MDSLSHLLQPLNTVLFVVGNDRVSVAELLGFLTGAACVWLTVGARISNFPVGIANSAFFMVLFLAARLYADSALQVVYILLGFAGWWQWLRRGPKGTQLAVSWSSPWALVGCLIFVLSATLGLTWLLRSTHDSAPFWDALTTAISLAAQLLLNAKKMENWAFWIVADVIYVPLYFAERLDLTAVVYVLFLGLCGMGFVAWRRAFRPSSTTLTGVAALPVESMP